jgi:preprotein translocase subunit SecY
MMRQMETHLLQRHYDGFLRKGKIKGRYHKLQNTGEAASKGMLIYLWLFIAIVVVGAVSYWIYTGAIS